MTLQKDDFITTVRSGYVQKAVDAECYNYIKENLWDFKETNFEDLRRLSTPEEIEEWYKNHEALLNEEVKTLQEDDYVWFSKEWKIKAVSGTIQRIKGFSLSGSLKLYDVNFNCQKSKIYPIPKNNALEYLKHKRELKKVSFTKKEMEASAALAEGAYSNHLASIKQTQDNPEVKVGDEIIITHKNGSRYWKDLLLTVQCKDGVGIVGKDVSGTKYNFLLSNIKYRKATSEEINKFIKEIKKKGHSVIVNQKKESWDNMFYIPEDLNMRGRDPSRWKSILGTWQAGEIRGAYVYFKNGLSLHRTKVLSDTLFNRARTAKLIETNKDAGKNDYQMKELNSVLLDRDSMEIKDNWRKIEKEIAIQAQWKERHAKAGKTGVLSTRGTVNEKYFRSNYLAGFDPYKTPFFDPVIPVVTSKINPNNFLLSKEDFDKAMEGIQEEWENRDILINTQRNIIQTSSYKEDEAEVLTNKINLKL